jgi:hemolysin III
MARLSLLVAEFGEDIPYVGALANGFPFRGRRVPFLNYQKGIYRAAVQTGPAALSIQTSSKSPYDDEVVADGFLYAYRAGDVDQSDNRALRAAHDLQVPVVYFVGTRPGTSQSSLASSERTTWRRAWFWWRRAPSRGQWMSPNRSRSKIRSNGGMRCARIDFGEPASYVLGMSVLKPRLRGLSHAIAFVIALPLGLALVLEADTGRGRLSAIVFAATVAAMFGASALYHSPNWREAPRRWLRRVDHAGIYALIAGTYTAFGLIALSGYWRWVVLSIVWAGALAGIVFKFAWLDAPKWISAVIGVALGWVGVVVAPQLLHAIGVGALLLVLAGGLLYTLGALVYALRRPDPRPAVFGFHEVFHVLVIAAVACQYSAVAFFVLPEH